jgi:hypothetical protein
MHRFIPYSFVVACLLAVMPAYARDVGEWTGVWDTIWTDGGGRITLQQDGDSVTGEFPLYKSRVEGKVRGDRLEGRRIEGERSYEFVIVLGHDARSFAGRDDAQALPRQRHVDRIAGRYTQLLRQSFGECELQFTGDFRHSLL